MITIENVLLLSAGSGYPLGAILNDSDIKLPKDELFPSTLLIDGEQIQKVRALWLNQEERIIPIIEDLQSRGDRLLGITPFSVVDKTNIPEGHSPHDYLSHPKYWWREDDGQYVLRDGEKNPACDSDDYDLIRFDTFTNSVFLLAFVAYITRDKEYYEKAVSLLSHWFITENSRMNPSFEFAQKIPTGERFRWAGTIEARRLIYVMESIRLMDATIPLATELKSGLSEWFSSLLQWWETSESGIRASKSENNIALWYQLLRLNMHLFLGQEKFAKQIITTEALPMIESQVASDGRLTKELTRAKPYDYVAFSLVAISGIALLSEKLGFKELDSISNEGNSFSKALEWFQSLPQSTELRSSLAFTKVQTKGNCADEYNLLVSLILRVSETRRELISNLEKQNSNLEKQKHNADHKIAKVVQENDTYQNEITSFKKENRNYKKKFLKQDKKIESLQAKVEYERIRIREVKGRFSYRMARVVRFLDQFIPNKNITELPEKTSDLTRVAGSLQGLNLKSDSCSSREPLGSKLKAKRGSEEFSLSAAAAAWIPPAKPDGDTSHLVENDYILYRIIGNDLFPRHALGQTRANVEFILENEPLHSNCKKKWIINRIVNKNEESAILDLLHKYDADFIHIPFKFEEYASITYDKLHFKKANFILSKDYLELDPEHKLRADVQARRLKNNYVMHNNGARNLALEDGKGLARWILPFDGNCFLSQESWKLITASVENYSYLKYFAVPMARLTKNEDVLQKKFSPEATEEPQIIFRNDSVATFDAEHPYGRRPKVELLWRLKIPGKWDRWIDDPWELPRNPLSEEAGQFGYAGWVARLNSGKKNLEQADKSSFKNRGLARAEAIMATLDTLDEEVLKRKFNCKHLTAYSEERLKKIQDSYLAEGEEDYYLTQKICKLADEALHRGPFSVIDKTTLPPSGNRNDYWHPAPYWWPNPNTKDGLPYVQRDGQRISGTELYEPKSERYDRSRLQRLFDDGVILSIAAFVSGNRKYGEHAARSLRRWFIDQKTRMNPNLEYAQVRMKKKSSRGAPSGIIETKDLYFYLDAVRLLEREGYLSNDEIVSFKVWIKDFRNWLKDSSQGNQEFRKINNHGSLYDLQMAAISAYLGDTKELSFILQRNALRIADHIKTDGTQPHEMTRTMTLHYCTFNLQGWMNFARLAKRCGIDYWALECSKEPIIGKAACWLLSFGQNKKWPYEQIKPFDWNRLLPIFLEANSEYLIPSSSKIKIPDSIPACLNPHDGVAPLWQLTFSHYPSEKEVADLRRRVTIELKKGDSI